MVEARYFRSPAEFRRWLAEHHAVADELLVGFHRKSTGVPSLTWQESVDEALCFGWIDGVRRTVDATRYTIRFTPRRTGSTWSAINIGRVAALEKLGRMRAAGRKAFAARSETKSQIYAYEQRERAVFGPPEQKQFRSTAQAWAFFERQPAGYRQKATYWVMTAKAEATRQRRLQKLVAESAAGRRI
jgi:uncharacterized protein YdeI (YjbR/CyaY-like superfamily)